MKHPVFRVGYVQQKENILEIQNSLRSLVLYFQSLEEANKTINYKEITAEVHVKNNHSYYTEAGLVNKLESLEIGRPSTYSTIIETLKDRGYVKKQNYEGIEVECNNYVLEDKKIKLNKIKKFFGAEKNKLFIQPIGKLALEFLVENFDSVFTYEYTKTMENKLDLISNKEIDDWATICKECYNELKTLSSSMKNLEKKSYPICENYEFIFEKYGPVIKHLKEDGEIEYIQGNKQLSIDIDKLKDGKGRGNAVQYAKIYIEVDGYLEEIKRMEVQENNIIGAQQGLRLVLKPVKSKKIILPPGVRGDY